MPILGIMASQISGHLWAPAGAYDSLATVTVGSTAVSSIDFTGIPSGYTHLQIRALTRYTRAGASTGQAILQFNGDTTAANYRGHVLYGDGTSAAAGDNTGIGGIYAIDGTATTATAGMFGTSIVDILDYGSTIKNKTARLLGGWELNGSGQVRMYSGFWMNSSTAISSIKILPFYGTAIEQYSSFALYGIKQTMATSTYQALLTQTLSTAAASVTFNSIPQGYTDLVLVFNGKLAIASDASISLQFNGDTTTNYSETILSGNGTSAISVREINQTGAIMGYVNQNDGTSIINVMNYSNATTYKTVIGRGGVAATAVRANVALWRKAPEAITSMVVGNNGGINFAIGTTFTIYGIAAEPIAVAKATGGTITSDVSYFYHTFKTGGFFVPNQALSCDVLVVAGGGGGGNSGSGGGGAGGLLGFTSQSLTSGTSYTATVGAGGAIGTVGVDSQFGTLTLVKGGGIGGNPTTRPGGNGGSGGGAQGGFGDYPGGSPTSGQGFAGGAGTAAAAGSGGGAGAVGATGGAGGIGLNTYSSWATATSTGVSGYYAGGGGGGGNAGGTGGGGSGATAGIANTGGGGGGANGSSAGGSGIVIIRYPK